MKSKHLVAPLLLLATATIAFSGVVGFFTKETRDWDFIQAVGGMRVSAEEKTLVVDCNVSGLRKVTVEPTLVNSGIGVRELKHERIGNILQLSLVTSVLEKGMSSACSPIDVSAYPAGIYTVQYVDRDRTVHPLGTVTFGGNPSGK